MKHLSRLILAAVLVVIVASPLRAEEADDSALSAGVEYARLYKSGQCAQAIQRYWDFDTLLTLICRDDLTKYTPEQQRAMAVTLSRAVRQLLANPRVVTALSKAEYHSFEQKQMSDTLTAVRFMVRFPDGKDIPNTLIFQRQENHWKVVNAGTGGGTLMSATLHDEYAKSGLTPDQYVRGLEEMFASTN